MIKKILVILALFSSFSCFASSIVNLKQPISNYACPLALPPSDPGFCASFQTAAQCRCKASGLPDAACKSVSMIYDRMISVFGSVQKACNYQRDTSPQECIDDWSCFKNGGKDSQGRACSGTGRAC